MNERKKHLPHLSDKKYISDGGLESTLVFHQGFDLPEFAAFDLLKRFGGYETLRDYYKPYVDLALQGGVGFILESATWRASQDWGKKLGYSQGDLLEVNRAAITLLKDIRNQHETRQSPMIISGCIGPRGDGYLVSDKMTVWEAAYYHLEQISSLSRAGADIITTFTMNYQEEAAGIVLAAKSAGMPVAVGFTVETDGRLPSGQSLEDAIRSVDSATSGGPAYYMINCAHPAHFADKLLEGGAWVDRIRAIRPNASTKSHAELDESVEIDIGDPEDLALRVGDLGRLLPHLNVFGGCCGTDHRHVEHILREINETTINVPTECIIGEAGEGVHCQL